MHFHIIPKPNVSEGLGITWPIKDTDQSFVKSLAEKIKSKMSPS